MKSDIRPTFFNTGEKTIQLGPRQSKAFNTVCQMSSRAKGDYTVTVAKIFDNPTRDGRQAGKVIGENLVWRQSDKN